MLGEKRVDKKAHDFTSTFEEAKEASEDMFGSEDRKLLREILRAVWMV